MEEFAAQLAIRPRDLPQLRRKRLLRALAALRGSLFCVSPADGWRIPYIVANGTWNEQISGDWRVLHGLDWTKLSFGYHAAKIENRGTRRLDSDS
ncbi:MAG: hypothetical protein ACYDD2_07430 [Candidatus Acidiferrales bacterium]